MLAGMINRSVNLGVCSRESAPAESGEAPTALPFFSSLSVIVDVDGDLENVFDSGLRCVSFNSVDMSATNIASKIRGARQLPFWRRGDETDLLLVNLGHDILCEIL
jgi:hypothetical protein